MNAQTKQEVVSERDQEHIVMLAQPAAHLVMVRYFGTIMTHSDFTFGFFKDGFNRPMHTADPHELVQRRVGRSVAEVVSI